MNRTEQDLEQTLRAAPQPKAPAGLEQKLLSEIATASRQTSTTFIRSTWLQRWWPALAPAAVSLACAAVITGQQLKINDLTKNLQTLSEPAVSAAVANAPSGDPSNNSITQPGTADSEEAEIQRLKQVVANLSQEIERLERMKGENEKLRAQLTTGFAANITPQERENLQKLKEKANSTMCINNLKQIGLALRVWSLDNQDAYPPNFLVVSNELSTPKILACPSDTAHSPASDWVGLKFDFMISVRGHIATPCCFLSYTFDASINGGTTLARSVPARLWTATNLLNVLKRDMNRIHR